MQSRQRRVDGDNGATLLESALITPVLLLFVFGIFEFGFAFRDYLAASNTARDAARAASIAANDSYADHSVLLAARRASAALPDGSIERLVIFEADGPGATVPSSCLIGPNGQDGSGPDGAYCNVYTPANFSDPQENFGCDASVIAPGAPDRFWCPTTRATSAGTQLDYVGIYVQVRHEYITGLFGDDIVFEDTMVLKIEPQEN